MALGETGSALGDKIANLIIAPDAPPEARQKIIMLWENIGEAIVSHFISNTELDVNAGISVTTTGSAMAQTGKTTEKGTGKIK
jgi:hypothetical protein